MSTLKPCNWLFSIENPDNDTFVLYAPLHGAAFLLKRGALAYVNSLIIGEEKGNLEGIDELFDRYDLLEMPDAWKDEEDGFKQVVNQALTLSITNKCNLRCIYCYAETGVEFTTMSWEVAKAAMDRVAKESLTMGRNFFRIVFHGGGEAFVEYDLLQRCVAYAMDLAEKSNLIPEFSIVTNATLIDEEKAKWLSDSRFKHISVSLDGIEEIQNLQRPHSSGHGSYQEVMQGIKHIGNAGVSFSIRATVTRHNVGCMDDFVILVAEEIFTNGGVVHFEPVNLCGRAKESSLAVTSQEYLKNYRKSKKVGEKLGVKITCSIDKFKKDKRRFCSASNASMFCVTPGGNVSACSRITKRSDSGSELYFFGIYDKDCGYFKIDEEQRLKIYTHGKLPDKCGVCFARWNCQGGCPISRYSDIEDTEAFCELTRAVLKESVLEEFSRT